MFLYNCFRNFWLKWSISISCSSFATDSKVFATAVSALSVFTYLTSC
jgi:hypothetical protein